MTPCDKLMNYDNYLQGRRARAIIMYIHFNNTIFKVIYISVNVAQLVIHDD